MNKMSNIKIDTGRLEKQNANAHHEEYKLDHKLTFKTLQPVEIQFENLQYNASLGFQKGMKTILHNLYGRFLPGQLIAIMGPSGAGKSRLLDSLSGYRKTGVTGLITDNGIKRDWSEFKKRSCYITQDHSLQLLLTINENMKFAADLKLTSQYNEAEKWSIIDNILETLGLSEASNTIVGKLSGGEKKRLSIALELINSPSVMFLDEPTTGLDSLSSLLCIKILKHLALQGRTIICTIHQPSASLFQYFDHVYALADGKCIYQGSANNIIPYLEELKLPCPKYHNPADYAMELACGEYGRNKICTLVSCTENGKSTRWFKISETQPSTPLIEGSLSGKVSQNSQITQLKVILRRGFLKVKRDTIYTYMRIVVYLVAGLMLGLLFQNCGNDATKVLENFNLLFAIIVCHIMFTMMITVFAFQIEVPMLINERFNRWYSLRSYYFMINIVEIPVTAGCCILFTTIVYLMSNQPLEWKRFLIFMILSLLIVFVIQSFGYIAAATFSNFVNAGFAGNVLLIMLTAFSGFPVNLNDIPIYLSWGPVISFLRYGLEGYVGAIYGLERATLPCDEHFYCHFKHPKKFLHAVAMRGDAYNTCIIILTIILILTKLVAYFLLRWKIKSLR